MKYIWNIIHREGGYVNNPNDKGGPTKYGITLSTLRAYRQSKKLTAEDVERLTEQEAFDIYFDMYVVKPRFHLIDDEFLQECIVDAGVNHGVRRASMWLQMATNEVGNTRLQIDGIVGPLTLGCVRSQQAMRLAFAFCRIRMKFFGQITSDNALDYKSGNTHRLYAVFTEGWLNRLDHFLEKINQQMT